MISACFVNVYFEGQSCTDKYTVCHDTSIGCTRCVVVHYDFQMKKGLMHLKLAAKQHFRRFSLEGSDGFRLIVSGVKFAITQIV